MRRLFAIVLFRAGLVSTGLFFAAANICLATDVQNEFAPDRWDRVPLGGSKEFPVVGVRLCDQPHAVTCTVRAEMRVATSQTPTTLNEWQQRAKERQAKNSEIVIPVKREKFHGADAVKSAHKGRLSAHIEKIVVSEELAFETSGDVVVCSLTAEPGDYPKIEQTFLQFCRDVDILKLKKD